MTSYWMDDEVGSLIDELGNMTLSCCLFESEYLGMSF